MNHASLFSGIGGFDLAAQWMGWKNIFHCEWEPFPQKILKYYWPNAISYGDITKTDFSRHYGQIDILTGGFPCQPYSSAGKRKGKEDERHLWPEMLRAVREIRPSWIVGENVRGLTNWNGGLVFDEVQADLETEGYEVTPFLLPACAVNAPHRRDRIWFVAYSSSNGHESGRFKKNRCKKTESKSEKKQWQRLRNDSWRIGKQGIVTDPTSYRRERQGQRIEIKEGLQPRSEPARQLEGGFEGLRKTKAAANTGSEQLQERSSNGKFKDKKEETTGMDNLLKRSSNIRNASDTSNEGLQRWELNGASYQETKEQRQQPSGSTTERHKITNWNRWPTQPPICGRDDGLPTQLDGITFSKWRQESIKGYGNAVVPQVVLQIFKAIELYDYENTK